MWSTRDVYEQRETRLTELEAASADREARVSALEEVVAALREENQWLNQSSAALTAERDQLAAHIAAAGTPQANATTTPPAEQTDPSAANLINTAHPDLGEPMPARTSQTGATDSHAAAAATSADDGLDA